ncbi:uncharacterized protein [Triticum aestivum]|uniref:uncharacterized protein n=1 Tax=Triticum aestivum TaxID=4565 RepID=UPI001D0107BC|nr:uncharacterized protein LOC123140927 [Triticum aestivum]
MRREEGETGSSIPRHPRSPVVGPLEDDDLLLEILLRLPPQPSSLPRASAVCRQWRLLVTDPGFSRRFCRYHRRNLPIIGFYNRHLPDISFVPTLKDLDRIPPGRLSLQPQRDDQNFSTFGCRHGLVLVHVRDFEPLKHHILVWDPVTGEQHDPGIPLGIDTGNRFNGAVLRATGNFDHFQVVLIGNSDKRRAVASVYSSETGVWSNLVSTSTSLPLMDTTDPFSGWCFNGLPVCVGAGSETGSNDRFSITQAEDGGLGFLSLSGFNAQLWKRKTKYDGIASWVMEKIIELDKLLKIPMDPNRNEHVIKVIGFAENNNAVFLYTKIGIVAFHLESLQFKKLPGSRSVAYYYPFESVWCM